MINDKQSSVEWLAQQLYEQMEMCGDGGVYDKIIKQAKVLHEQEICQTYIDAIKEYMIDPLGDTLYRIDAEEYYNEIFGDINNGEITMMGGDNNIPDTNTSTTGNISGNIWGGDRTSTTENISGTWGGDTSNNTIYDSNTWRSWQKSIDENNNRIAEEKKIWDGTTMAEYLSKTEAEKQIWDKTVNWDIMNKHTRVRDEEQALYNKTIVVKDGAMETIRVSKPDETNDGTLAVIEITIDIKQR